MLPLTIVCGNSHTMIDIVQSTINRIDCKEVAMGHYGVIVIRRI